MVSRAPKSSPASSPKSEPQPEKPVQPASPQSASAMQLPNISTADIMSNYSLLLYIAMIIVTLFSGIGQFLCTIPGIVIAGLFYMAAPNDKKLLNNILLAAGLMLLHTALNFVAMLLMLVYIGIIIYPLEILVFCVVYGYLAYMCYKDKSFVLFKILQ